MKLGIDLDDTVCKTNELLIQEALKYDKEYVKGRGFKDPDAYSFMEMFYWSVVDVSNFFDRVRKGKFFVNIEPKEKVSFYLNELYDEGYEIIFITKRKDSWRVRRNTRKWLKKNGIKYHKLYLGADDKTKICLNEKIDLFIDNDKHNVKSAIDAGIKTYMMSDGYNQDITLYDRVNSWEEIYDKIRG